MSHVTAGHFQTLTQISSFSAVFFLLSSCLTIVTCHLNALCVIYSTLQIDYFTLHYYKSGWWRWWWYFFKKVNILNIRLSQILWPSTYGVLEMTRPSNARCLLHKRSIAVITSGRRAAATVCPRPSPPPWAPTAFRRLAEQQFPTANTLSRPPLQPPDTPTRRWAKRPGDLDIWSWRCCPSQV